MLGKENRGSHRLMKEINIRLVFSLIKQRSPISRITISKETGLSKSSVSEIVDYLIEKGIVREGGSGDSIGGRRPILLYLNSKGRFSVGIQVGDYGEIRGVLCDLKSRIIKEKYSFCLNQDELVERICEVIDYLIEGTENSVLGVGLAVPGIVDYQSGSIVSAVNPGWANVSLATDLKAKFNFPIYVENATNAIALGENWFGSGADFENMIFVRIGSIVGATIIINGVLHRGKGGSAGELGHMVVTNEKIKCRCGRYGCIESLISKPAVYRKVLLKGITINQVNPNNVFKWLVDQEDSEEYKSLGKELLCDIANNLAITIANLVNLLGTDAIIIESELTDSNYFMEVIIDKVTSEILPRPGKKLEIRKSLLGENNVELGAATLVLQYAFNVSEASTSKLSVRQI